MPILLSLAKLFTLVQSELENKKMIPDFQTLMLPLLRFIADEKNHSTKDTVTYLSNEFNLTEEELNEWLPSKVQKVFYNRVHWAKAHLKMADLIENVNRGIFKITENGKRILLKNPERITMRYLVSERKLRTFSNKFIFQIFPGDVDSALGQFLPVRARI